MESEPKRKPLINLFKRKKRMEEEIQTESEPKRKPSINLFQRKKKLEPTRKPSISLSKGKRKYIKKQEQKSQLRKRQ